MFEGMYVPTCVCVSVCIEGLGERASVFMGMHASEWHRRDLLQDCGGPAPLKVVYSQFP